MKRDWKLLAQALSLDIPDSDLEKVTLALDALEASFRPLAGKIPHETEPAVIYFCAAEEAE